tara:strand:+ start:453 stop:1334 length:882 start_codon:yes stop_codon:yes gene_type:complete
MSIYSDVTLIVVCFKSEELIRSNLKELKKFKTIIVDNSDSKETYNLVKDVSNIEYIKTHKNIGYGMANNLGVKNAKTPYIMIINPDVVVDSDSIRLLYEKYLNYRNVGLVAPSLYDTNNERRTNGSISRLKKNKSKNLDVQNLAEGDTCYDFVVGCSLFMSRDFFNKVGGFDKDFFMYFEDNDICDKIYRHNRYILEIPDSKMVHIEGLSSNFNYLTNIKLSIIHKISEYIYYRKNMSVIRLYLIILKHFFDFTQRLIVNFLLFRFKKSFQNFLRIISIFFYISKLYLILLKI